MSLRSWLEEWFGRPGKSVLRVNDGRMVAAGYFPTLPTAGGDFRYALAANASGVQACQPVGTGWAWTPLGSAGTLRIYQDADYTGTSNSSSAQKFFDESTNGAASVAASTVYDLKAKIHLHTTDADASDVRILFGGTATLNWIGFSCHAVQATTETFGTPVEGWITTAAATVILGSTSAAKHLTITYDGHVSVNAAGTFIPQYQFGSNNQASPVTLRGSWLSLTPVAATTEGSWS